ncbi:MAG: response regulator [Promethearchaeota archaeon]|nr:MAG: response regulator [Candidatus Lokiarchaeota archaeon]
MKSIFIVEDDSSIKKIYEKFLKLRGYDVIDTASNGQEAVEKFKNFEKKPNVILMDHRMPILSGIDATKQILEISNTSHIIFISADRSVKQEALSLGVTSFLEKPISLNNLIEFLNTL